MRLVIDASALLKAYFPDEHGTENAKEIIFRYSLGDLELSAPSLMDYEISNAVFTAYKRKRVPFNDARNILEKILGLDIKRHDFHSFKNELLDLGKKYNLSVYDASYLALALRLNADMVTGDEKLAKAVKGKAPRVILVRDFH